MFETLINRESTRYIVVDFTNTTTVTSIPVTKIDFLDRQAGYFGCRYHYVIQRDGTIQSGRPLEKQSPLSRVANDSSICVALVGGLSQRGHPTDNTTPAQKEALLNLCREVRKDHPRVKAVLLSDMIRRRQPAVKFNMEPYNP